MPSAASVITSASITGAATSTAATGDAGERVLRRPRTSDPSAGALSSGTSSYVRARPWITQVSPPMAMNTPIVTSAYSCDSTDDWLPLIGSISEPNEKPTSVSR